MNVMLQRRCARYIYVVPEGLRELMTDISREVIRTDPENIYTYIADYLDALLITRENARVAARLVQSITEIAITTVELLTNAGMSRSDADRVVSIIEMCFRKQIQPTSVNIRADLPDEYEEINIVTDIIDQAEIPPEVGEAAAKIIQRAYRRFKVRREKERELLSGMVDWRIAARSAIRLYRKTGVTYEEANRAATLIKAAYKGYYTRRIMRKLAEERRMLADREESEGGSEYDMFLRDQKCVTIDYGSIIPHVDFDETKVTEAESVSQEPSVTPEPTHVESTISTVVYSLTESILDMTFDEIRRKESLMLGAEDDVKSDKQMYIEKIQAEMMQAVYQHEDEMFPVTEEPREETEQFDQQVHHEDRTQAAAHVKTEGHMEAAEGEVSERLEAEEGGTEMASPEAQPEHPEEPPTTEDTQPTE